MCMVYDTKLPRGAIILRMVRAPTQPATPNLAFALATGPSSSLIGARFSLPAAMDVLDDAPDMSDSVDEAVTGVMGDVGD